MSGNVGALAVLIAVAAHIPGGGSASRMRSVAARAREAIVDERRGRVFVAESVEAVVPERPTVGDEGGDV